MTDSKHRDRGPARYPEPAEVAAAWADAASPGEVLERQPADDMRVCRGMRPDEIKTARAALGLSAEGFARLVGAESGRTVRRWEAGDRDIPGGVRVLTRAIMASGAVRAHFGLSIEGDAPATPD